MRPNQCLFLTWIVFLSVSLNSAQNPDPNKYAVAEGKVTNSATGEPVVRAFVSIEPVLQKSSDPENDNPVFATETEDTGVFHFSKLPADKYNVVVQKPGFLRTSYGAHRPAGPGVPVELVAGERRAGLDVKLPPEAVVSGTVTDDHGEPARSCRVHLMKRGWRNGRSTLLPSAGSPTDSQGSFRITGITPGRYYLRAECWPVYTNFVRQPTLVGRDGNVIKVRVVPTYLGSSITVDGASLITVQSGQEVGGQDIRLRREAVYHVRGKVMSLPPGESAISYRLFLFAPNGGFSLGGASARVKRDGSFELDNIQPGTYDLGGSHGNHEIRISTMLDINSDVDNLEVSIPVPVELHGRIRVEGEPSTPLSAISLALIDSNGTYIGDTDVAADGSFKLENVTADQYGIDFAFPGESAFIKSVRVGRKETPSRSLDLTQGAGPIELVVSLNPAKVEVTVTKEDPKSNQQVSAEAVNVVLVPQVRTQEWLGGLIWGSTDKDGLHTFKNVPPGKYQAFAADGLDAQEWADPESRRRLKIMRSRLKLGRKNRSKST